MNNQFLTVWELSREERDLLYASWLSWALDLMRSSGSIEQEEMGELCVIESLHEAMRLCSCAEGAPNLIGKVYPERLFWELVRIGVVFPDRKTLRGRNRTLFTLFRVAAIQAFCEKHGAQAWS